jgi:predicted dehydrogenase
MSELAVRQTVDLPRRPLPIVSIGLGGIVEASHYPAYQKAGFHIIGGYDANVSRAAMMKDKFSLPRIYESLEEAISAAPPDAVFDVAVPGSAILDILRVIPEGRAVLLQKPMGETLEEARAILKLCREKRLTAAVNFQMRFAPFIIAARDMLERGLIGELNDLEVRMQVYTPWDLWSFLMTAPRLEILYHSIHYIDLVRSFLGNPKKVYAKTLKHPLTPNLAPTRTMLILDYGDQVRVNIMTNHGHVYGPQKQQSYVKWEGSKGAIEARAGVNMNYPGGVPDKFEYVLLEEGKTPEWKTLSVEGSWFPDAFIGTMSSLMRYVNRETDTLPTSVEDAIQTMATVEAAYLSSENDGTPLPAIDG